MTENKEFLKTVSFTRLKFTDPADAMRQYSSLPDNVKEGMAKCYKAFEEEPWFDPPYNIPELVSQGFPEMVSSFVPGAVAIAQNEMGEVIGFASGGQTTVDKLVQKKYSGETSEDKSKIARAIMDKTGLSPEDMFMYENELVLLSDANLPAGGESVRNKGLGTELSRQRQTIFEDIGYGAILGRSLNPYLLQMKEKLFSEQNGFRMTKFIPDGDGYTNPVTGTKRTIYFAAKIR